MCPDHEAWDPVVWKREKDNTDVAERQRHFIEAHQINHNASQISCTSVKCYEMLHVITALLTYITASYTYTFKELHKIWYE